MSTSWTCSVSTGKTRPTRSPARSADAARQSSGQRGWLSMLVNREQGLVIATPFGCAAKPESVTSPEDFVGERYGWEVPEEYRHYGRAVIVRNPYFRMVLLWKWSLASELSPFHLYTTNKGVNFSKFVHHVGNRSRNATGAMLKADPPQIVRDIYQIMAPFKLYIWNMGLLEAPGDVAVIRMEHIEEDAPWLGLESSADDDGWENEFYRGREKWGLRLKTGTVWEVDQIWAARDCMKIPTYSRLSGNVDQ